MSYEEEAKFFREEFMKQLEYNRFISEQLRDLHMFIMSNSYYQAGGSMSMHFNPQAVEDIVYRPYKEEKEC